MQAEPKPWAYRDDGQCSTTVMHRMPKWIQIQRPFQGQKYLVTTKYSS